MDITLERDSLPEARQFMEQLSAEYEKATGVDGRGDYSAFYGPCLRSPLLVLNANPGGSSDDFKIVRVDEGEHEYIEGHGKTSQSTGRILQEALNATGPEGIRGVQGSNVIWRRSPNLAKLAMNQLAAARETAPFLARLIEHVSPSVILFGGSSAFDLFMRSHEPQRKAFPAETIRGPGGRSEVILFAHDNLVLPYLDQAVEAYTILHPSKGRRPVAMEALKQALNTRFGN